MRNLFVCAECLHEKSQQFFQGAHYEATAVVRQMLEHEQWMRVPVLLVDETAAAASHNRSNSSNSTSGNTHKRSSSATSTSSTASASTAGSSATTPTAAGAGATVTAAHGGVGSLVAAAAARFCSPGGANRCISAKYTPLLSDIAAAGEAGGGLAVKLLQEWGTRGNPFQFGSTTDEPVAVASSAGGSSAVPATAASASSGSSGGDSDDDNDTVAAAAAVPETKECAAVVAAASATAEERDRYGSQWVVTQAALNGLTRYTGHYLQMMRLIRPIAGEAFAGLCGLADLYLYTVFTLFAPRSRVAGLYGVGEEKSMPLVSEQEEFAELKEFMQRVRSNLAPQQSAAAAAGGSTTPNSYRGGTVTPENGYTPPGSTLVTPLASPRRDGAAASMHSPGTPSYSNSSTTATASAATGGMSHSPSGGNVAGSGSPQRPGTTTGSHSPNREGSGGASTPSTNSLVEALLPHRPIPPSASSSSSTVNAMAGIVGMSTAPPAPPVPKAVLPTPECLKTGAVGRYDSCAVAERVVAAESCLFVVQVLAAAQCRAHARKLLPLKDRARLVLIIM
jgi:hypothetical protein